MYCLGHRRKPEVNKTLSFSAGWRTKRRRIIGFRDMTRNMWEYNHISGIFTIENRIITGMYVYLTSTYRSQIVILQKLEFWKNWKMHSQNIFAECVLTQIKISGYSKCIAKDIEVYQMFTLFFGFCSGWCTKRTKNRWFLSFAHFWDQFPSNLSWKYMNFYEILWFFLIFFKKNEFQNEQHILRLTFDKS